MQKDAENVNLVKKVEILEKKLENLNEFILKVS